MRKLILIVLAGLSLSAAMLSQPSPAPVFAEASTTSTQVQIQTIPGPTVAAKLSERIHKSWSWYLTRASGMVAAITLVLLLISGIGQVTGYMFHILDPITSWASHRALGVTFGVSLFVHITSILFDHFVPFSLKQVLVPFASTYRPVRLFGHNFGSLYVALGVFAFYLTALIIVTSYIWINKQPKLWKLTHLLSYVVMILVFFHALNIGTDLATGYWRYAWFAAAGIVGFSFIHRLWRAYTT